MSVGCAGSNQSGAPVAVPPLLPPHLVSPLGDGTGSSPSTALVPRNAGHRPTARPAGNITCLGSSKGLPSPWIRVPRDTGSPEQSKKSCSASQTMCHPARCWGPHLGDTWKHQISLDLQLPGAAGSGMSSKLLKCIRRGKCCRGREFG